MKLTNHEWDVIDACVTYKIWKNCIILSIKLSSRVLSIIEIKRRFGIYLQKVFLLVIPCQT